MKADQFQELFHHFRGNHGITIRKNGEGYQVVDFYIRPEEVIKERKSIVGTIQEQVTEFVIYGVEMIPATPFEPEDADEVELSRKPTLAKAVARVIVLELEEKLRQEVEELELYWKLEEEQLEDV